MNTRERIIKALPGTTTQLMARTGLSFSVTKWHTRTLREEGNVHVCEWLRTPGRPAVAVYAWAPCQSDVPLILKKPQPKGKKDDCEPVAYLGPMPDVGESTACYAVRVRPELARVWA